MNTHTVGASGLINFRDFGGQALPGGASVRSDLLYRCGHLARVASGDLAHILDLDFGMVADLRYVGERESEPSPWPLALSERVLFHGGERNAEAPHLAMLRNGSLTVEAVGHFYLEFYRDIPYDDLYRPLFAQVIARVAESEGRLLVHCAAGKDRTGILCAMILDLLGVPRQVIIADYLRSADAPGLKAMKPKIIARTLRRYGHAVSEEAVDALLGVSPSYLETMFAAVEARDGSVAAYLQGSGMSGEALDRLRARLIEA